MEVHCGKKAIALGIAIASLLANSATAKPLPLAQNPPPPPANPQSDPNRDRFTQPVSEPTPTPPETTPVTPPPAADSPDSDNASQTFEIQTVEVVGNTIFDTATLDPIINPLEGTTVTRSQLQAAADAITQLYLEGGYLTSRAILAEPPVTDAGVAQILAIEGRLQRIDIDGNRRVNDAYIRNRIALAAEAPLNTQTLEEQLRLLRLNPRFDNIEANLKAAEEFGESILVVRVDEANLFRGEVSVDNYSSPSIGSERLGVQAQYLSLTGQGDELAGSYHFSTRGGSDVFDVSYRLPVNAMNGMLELRAAPNNHDIVQDPFDEFGIEGEEELYEISYRQPIMRSLRHEFALSLGFTFQDSQTFLNEEPFGFGIGPEEDGFSRTRVVQFGQDYVRREPGGAWALRSQFNLGTNWFDATENDGDIPDGQFISWLGQVQRVQQLGEDHLLVVRGDVQLAPDGLLPNQQFLIGGGRSLRGYRQNVRAGDNGFRLSIEDRITVGRDAAGLETFQLIPFADIGTVWNAGDNPNDLPDQTFLAGVGLGLWWEVVPGWEVRLDYGLPLVDLDDRGDNIQDDGFYFSVSYGFGR
jgi:hemolysin activation/secretion protein